MKGVDDITVEKGHEFCIYRGEKDEGLSGVVGICTLGSFSALTKYNGRWSVPIEKHEQVSLIRILERKDFEAIFDFLPEEGTKCVVELSAQIKHEENS